MIKLCIKLFVAWLKSTSQLHNIYANMSCVKYVIESTIFKICKLKVEYAGTPKELDIISINYGYTTSNISFHLE